MSRKALKEYRIVWEVVVYAANPRDAAQKAFEMHRDPESTATVFDVYRQKLDEGRLFAAATPVRVDLGEYRQRASTRQRR